MKRTIAALTGLILAAALTGCADNNEAFTEKSYTIDGEKISEVCIEVQDRQIDVTLSDDDFQK